MSKYGFYLGRNFRSLLEAILEAMEYLVLQKQHLALWIQAFQHKEGKISFPKFSDSSTINDISGV